MSKEAESTSVNLEAKLKKRWWCLWPITAAFLVFPINNGLLRITLLLLGMLLFSGLLGFYWQRKRLRVAVLTGVVCLGVFLSLPGKTPNPLKLRERYLRSLHSYEGTRYVWGGEGRLGIDCSGLLRASLINSFLGEGLRTMNPKAIRLGIRLWWHDCSARALGEEHEHLTRHLFDGSTINQLDHRRIEPGDMAVTDDGLHVLAYLGDSTWIQADPNAKKVIILKAPASNEWYRATVKILRWQALLRTELPITSSASPRLPSSP